jgi:hypothetical protein
VIPGWGEPFSFDAETAVDVVVEQFLITEVLRRNTAAVRLRMPPRYGCSFGSRAERGSSGG